MVKKQEKGSRAKNFLRPTKQKIFLVLLITGLLFLFLYLGGIFEAISFYMVYLPFLSTIIFPEKIAGDVSLFTLPQMTSFLVVYFLEVYFFSCIILTIAKLVKKKM